MIGYGLGRIDALQVLERAPEPEIRVFEVGFEGRIEQSHAGKQSAAEQRGGAGSHRDWARLRELHSIHAALPSSPGAGRSRDQVIGPVDPVAMKSAQNLASREPGVIG